ncbi:MAG: glycine oxidase ThiO [Phycisphaerae bacterium]
MSPNCDVIIIGGGIIGLSIADRLARDGVKVTLLEKGLCGRESSWAAPGVLQPHNPNRHGPMQDMLRASLGLYANYCAQLQSRTGIDPQYRPCDMLELLVDDQRYRMALSEQRASQKRQFFDPHGQLEWEVVTPEAGGELESAIRAECLGVLVGRNCAQVRPPRLLQALAASARQSGVEIQENTAVEGLVIDGARVRGVRTQSGAVSADTVVVAAGAWSSGIDPQIENAIPTYPARGQIVLLDASNPASGRLARMVERKGCYLVPRPEGLVLVGSTVEHESGFDRRTTPTGINRLLADAVRIIPGLAEAGVVALWSGLRPATPDRRPYLGPVPELEGLIAATGHFRSGIVLAPVTARIVADLIVHGRTDHDLSACRPGRST